MNTFNNLDFDESKRNGLVIRSNCGPQYSISSQTCLGQYFPVLAYILSYRHGFARMGGRPAFTPSTHRLVNLHPAADEHLVVRSNRAGKFWNAVCWPDCHAHGKRSSGGHPGCSHGSALPPTHYGSPHLRGLRRALSPRECMSPCRNCRYCRTSPHRWQHRPDWDCSRAEEPRSIAPQVRQTIQHRKKVLGSAFGR